MTPTPGREPGDELIDWIASGQRSYRSVLRALGQLFVALSADDAEPDEPARRAGAGQPRSFGLQRAPLRGGREPPQRESRVAEDGPPRARRAPFRAPELPPEATDDDIQLLLTDARARAHQLIDDSVAQAQALLAERSAGDAGQQALERLRAVVATVADEVRAIHRRLDAIEALLRPAPPAMPASPASRVEPEPPPPSSPPTSPVSRVEPDPPPPSPSPTSPASRVGPEPPPPSPSPTSPASRVEPEPPPEPPPPPASPPPAARTQPAPQSAPEPVVRAAPPTAEPPATSFSPDGGSVLLLVSPVSGFAGLMRLQDALVRVTGVSEAGVEAYSQGEARLRIQLSATIVPEELTRTLAEHVGQQARMESASAAERSMQVTLI